MLLKKAINKSILDITDIAIPHPLGKVYSSHSMHVPPHRSQQKNNHNSLTSNSTI